MATIVIENVPENIVKTFGTKISYNRVTSSFLPKKRVKLTENGFTEEFENAVLAAENDQNNTSYGPFTPDEFIAELKKM